jgi:hypothetical protein
MEKMKQWQDEMMSKHGFYIHFVSGVEEGYINAHTHGFSDTWNHSDFQIVVDIDRKVVSDIFWNFAHRVKKGEIFSSGMMVEEVISKYPVRLDTMEECGRSVLRVILPDADGHFPGDADVAPFFAHQVDVENVDESDHPHMN